MKKLNPKNPPKPCEYFDLIGGTSTGGYCIPNNLPVISADET
jgi:patatin-like phospholipase/acyl hydrolase